MKALDKAEFLKFCESVAEIHHIIQSSDDAGVDQVFRYVEGMVQTKIDVFMQGLSTNETIHVTQTMRLFRKHMGWDDE